MDNATERELEIYDIAKESLGRHMTLNPAVPAEVGCAEAVSSVLLKAGMKILPGGIAGTADLFAWLSLEASGFQQIAEPEAGAVIISPTIGSQHGHTGIVGAAGAIGNGMRGIMSNNSDSGLFLELWNTASWQQYYEAALGLRTYYFRAL